MATPTPPILTDTPKDQENKSKNTSSHQTRTVLGSGHAAKYEVLSPFSQSIDHLSNTYRARATCQALEPPWLTEAGDWGGGEDGKRGEAQGDRLSLLGACLPPCPSFLSFSSRDGSWRHPRPPRRFPSGETEAHVQQ